jgi:hypothetical protein
MVQEPCSLGERLLPRAGPIINSSHAAPGSSRSRPRRGPADRSIPDGAGTFAFLPTPPWHRTKSKAENLRRRPRTSAEAERIDLRGWAGSRDSSVLESLPRQAQAQIPAPLFVLGEGAWLVTTGPVYSKINRHIAEKNMSSFRLVAKNSREEENTTGEKQRASMDEHARRTSRCVGSRSGAGLRPGYSHGSA